MRFATPLVLLFTALASLAAALPAELPTTAGTLSATEFVSKFAAARNFTDPTTLNLTDPTVLESLRRDPLTCNPSWKSPLVSHLHLSANYMIQNNPASKLCAQRQNDYGMDTCYKLEPSYSTADIYICGRKGRNVRCHSVAWAAKHIANNCAIWTPFYGGGKIKVAEGMYWFEEARVHVLVTRPI